MREINKNPVKTYGALFSLSPVESLRPFVTMTVPAKKRSVV
jgi:hypothetical protein